MKTDRFRIKNNCRSLIDFAQKVNFVWNYCNEVSIRAWDYNRKWLSFYDLCKLTSGCSNELGLHSQSIRETVKLYSDRRNQRKKRKLRWRSAKRNLGFIPFNNISIKIVDDYAIFMGIKFRFWKSREIEGKIKTGSFSQDAKGNWYINFCCDVASKPIVKTGKSVGVDLGLKNLATTSDGEVIEGGKFFRRYEEKLATAQRAKKKRLVTNIHAKIKNSRTDQLHKITTKLVNQYDRIFVGDVSSSKLIKTYMAKSVTDISWSTLKSMLAYKAIALGVEYKEVKENYSTVTCSACDERTGPSGLSALGVRTWVCSNCGAEHQRDVNAAMNILKFGLGHQAPKGVLTINV